MSYDIRLCDPVTKEPININTPHFIQGGTYALNGTTELWLNITWNYGDWYRYEGVFPVVKKTAENGETYCNKGIRAIYDLTGVESIPVLEHAIEVINNIEENQILTEKDYKQFEKQEITRDSYWFPSKENVLRPLYQLITFAKMRPDGVWDGD